MQFQKSISTCNPLTVIGNSEGLGISNANLQLNYAATCKLEFTEGWKRGVKQDKKHAYLFFWWVGGIFSETTECLLFIQVQISQNVNSLERNIYSVKLEGESNKSNSTYQKGSIGSSNSAMGFDKRWF